jgi:hypothetical protein
VSVPEKVTKVLVGTELVNMELVVRPSNNWIRPWSAQIYL